MLVHHQTFWTLKSLLGLLTKPRTTSTEIGFSRSTVYFSLWLSVLVFETNWGSLKWPLETDSIAYKCLLSSFVSGIIAFTYLGTTFLSLKPLFSDFESSKWALISQLVQKKDSHCQAYVTAVLYSFYCCGAKSSAYHIVYSLFGCTLSSVSLFRITADEHSVPASARLPELAGGYFPAILSACSARLTVIVSIGSICVCPSVSQWSSEQLKKRYCLISMLVFLISGCMRYKTISHRATPTCKHFSDCVTSPDSAGVGCFFSKQTQLRKGNSLGSSKPVHRAFGSLKNKAPR